MIKNLAERLRVEAIKKMKKFIFQNPDVIVINL